MPPVPAAYPQRPLEGDGDEVPRARRVALIGCSKVKATTTCAAREMYRSALFRAALRWALLHADQVLVLSAKHGVLGLDDVIEPYDETLPRYQAGRLAWGARVAAELDRRLPDLDTELAVLAGELYADPIWFEDRDVYWSEPLRGLAIGERLAWLKANGWPVGDFPDHEAEEWKPAAGPSAEKAPMVCRVPTREEQLGFAREFPEWVAPMPGPGGGQ